MKVSVGLVAILAVLLLIGVAALVLHIAHEKKKLDAILKKANEKYENDKKKDNSTRPPLQMQRRFFRSSLRKKARKALDKIEKSVYNNRL